MMTMLTTTMTGIIGDLDDTELGKRKGVNFYKGGLGLFMFTLIPHELYEVTKLLITPLMYQKIHLNLTSKTWIGIRPTL